jgi:rhodanese-related sulfurtransferase
MRCIHPLLLMSVLPFCLLTALALADASAPPTGEELLDQAKAAVQDINTEELAALIERNPSAAVVDIRTGGEAWRAGGSIDAPRHLDIPRGWLELQIGTSVPERETPVVVYCGTNLRSPLAAQTLARMGYTRVYNYADGFSAWRDAGLPVFEDTDTSGWIDTWNAFEALGAEIVIPGHGEPTDMAQVTKYTKDYLVYMREQIGTLIDAGGGLTDAYEVDQSAYQHLDTFEELARRNAGRIFREMEFAF